jgi:hypothetical protein
MSGIAVCGGVGYGLDRLLGTYPALMIVGIIAGHLLGAYLVYAKYLPARGEPQETLPAPGVAGWSAAAPVHTADTVHPKPPELARWPHVMHADGESPDAS